MLIKTRKSYQLSEQQVTDESVYHSRRDLLKKLGYLGAGSLLAQSAASQASPIDFFSSKKDTVFQRHALTYAKAEESSQILTPEAKITTHNNFYEFGTNKGDPVENAQDFNVNPWQLKISGEVDKPYTLGYDDLFKRFPLEERIYRLRCVEAWSMVVPWVGFGLAQLIKQAAPNSKAKYVAFETLYDAK